jgi:hypothetical protein
VNAVSYFDFSSLSVQIASVQNSFCISERELEKRVFLVVIPAFFQLEKNASILSVYLKPVIKGLVNILAANAFLILGIACIEIFAKTPLRHILLAKVATLVFRVTQFTLFTLAGAELFLLSFNFILPGRVLYLSALKRAWCRDLQEADLMYFFRLLSCRKPIDAFPFSFMASRYYATEGEIATFAHDLYDEIQHSQVFMEKVEQSDELRSLLAEAGALLDNGAYYDDLNMKVFSLHRKAQRIEVAYDPPQISLSCGYRTAFIRQTFYEQMTERNSFTYAHFPEKREIYRFDDVVFTRLFQALEDSHSLQGGSRANQEIIEIFGIDYKELKAPLTAAALKGLLQRGDLQEEPPSFYVQLYMIVRYLFALSDCKGEDPENLEGIFPKDSYLGKEFSPREKALLLFANLVQNCLNGQKAGIARYYNALPLQYKLPKKEQFCENIAEEALRDFVYKVLTTTIAERFDTASLFVKESIGMRRGEEVAELPHQSLFLKNLIGKKVGLNHTVQYDENALVLYPQLFDVVIDQASTQLVSLVTRTLDTFYRHFTPQDAIDALTNAFNTLDVEKRMFSVVNEVIERHFKEPVQALESMWNMEDMSLTKLGALCLLQALRYCR